MSLALAQLATMDMDELTARLGEASTRGGSPLDFQHYLRVGQAIFEDLIEDIRTAICPKASQITATAESDPETIARDAAFIVDLLLASHGHLPLGTISVMIVKYGVGRLCDATLGRF